MPVRVDETAPLVSVDRVAADRRTGAVLLLNAGLDFVPEATVHLRLPIRHVRLLTIGRRSRTLPAEPEATGCRISLSDIDPWGLRVMLLSEES